ncbi:MAG: 2-dehydropantoate 2-reductase [Candidatus Erwinia impunctatus]|nr:2-dehydropantoate 2-reductase [Culicoides impunctatus]
MKITVLGCGALGQLWLHHLAAAGHQVQGWQKQHTTPLRYCLTTLSGDTLQAVCGSNDPQRLAESEILLVTLKSNQIASVLPDLLPVIAANCAIILLHNGMGVSEYLPSVSQPLLQAITTQAAMRQDGKVHHTANGITYIGALNQAAKEHSWLADSLHDALPEVLWHEQITLAAWHKLAVNCAINPLSVYHHCRNGELLHHPDQLKALCDEVAQVMRSEGIDVSNDLLYLKVMTVIEQTSANRCSMLQDVLARRTTEIESITGFLRQKAALHGIATPENDKLYQFIKKKEQHYVK